MRGYTPIDSVSEVKYLGVKIDETLSGDGILETIVKKYNGRIKFLYRQAGCLPTAVKKDSMPSTCSVSSRLCYIILVCCNDTESQTQVTNCPKQNG